MCLCILQSRFQWTRARLTVFVSWSRTNSWNCDQRRDHHDIFRFALIYRHTPVTPISFSSYNMMGGVGGGRCERKRSRYKYILSLNWRSCAVDVIKRSRHVRTSSSLYNPVIQTGILWPQWLWETDTKAHDVVYLKGERTQWSIFDQ